MTYSTRQFGFTMVEVVIALGIFAMIVAVLIDIYIGYNAVFAVQQARIDVNGSARTIATEFKQTAYQADHVVTSHVFSGTAYVSSSTTTVFELPSVDSSGNIIASTFDYVAIYATSTDAYKITDAGAGSARASGTRHISDTLSLLTFTYNNSDKTQATSTDVDAITQKTVRGQLIQAHVHETARLRNL